jgi:sugar/nucleoside kinase (ribokinase family)
VVVSGPASWNHLIVLDHLPEPVPHMQFATRSTHALGGTSAGKALHLSDLGVDTHLHALVGADADGERVRDALRVGGVAFTAHHSGDTERHVNLMTDAGERVSLYVAVPTSPPRDVLDAVALDIRAADIGVVDLSEFGALLLPLVQDAGTPLWVDLHDYDGVGAFHEPFLRAADVVFMNADATDDPDALLRSCLARGPRVAVCTLGARGAIARTSDGDRAETTAVPVDVVDTNGAGDAFMAGFLAATVRGESIAHRLRAGARQATVALSSVQLHPVLDARS